MATQYYETHLNRFESTLNIYVAQLGTSARSNTFLGLVLHQEYELPLEPDFRDLWRTIRTLIYRAKPINKEESHANKVRRIADIIARFKDVLGCHQQPQDLEFGSCKSANLTTANLSRAELYQANLRRITLSSANLSKSNLAKADMSMANLSKADLSQADLHEANLYRANLTQADMKGTDLSNVYLKEANLLQVKHLTCEQLISAKFWQSAYRDKPLACGASRPKKKSLSSKKIALF